MPGVTLSGRAQALRADWRNQGSSRHRPSTANWRFIGSEHFHVGCDRAGPRARPVCPIGRLHHRLRPSL